MTACMGGYCQKREACQHYHAADRRNPVERLCVPGIDGVLRVVVAQTLQQLIEGATL